MQFIFIYFFKDGVFYLNRDYIGEKIYRRKRMTLRFAQGLYSFMLVLATALLTKYFVTQGIDIFYGSLNLPEATPDNSYFSYIWRALYILLFISFFLILRADKPQELADDAGALFVSQLFLQILWAFSFFYLEQLTAAAIVIVLLDIVAALMIHTFFFISKTAFVLTLPYMLWLLFATYLNIYILFIN